VFLFFVSPFLFPDFKALILSQESPQQAQALFGITYEERKLATELSDDAIRLAWDLDGYKRMLCSVLPSLFFFCCIAFLSSVVFLSVSHVIAVQRVTPDMSVSVIAAADDGSRAENHDDIIQYNVHPRTQLRICTMKPESASRRKSLLGGLGASAKTNANEKTGPSASIGTPLRFWLLFWAWLAWLCFVLYFVFVVYLLSLVASVASRLPVPNSRLDTSLVVAGDLTEPQAQLATKCEICGVAAGETGRYMLATLLYNEFQKCQLCCMLRFRLSLCLIFLPDLLFS
jgi:hypothetical protein